MAGLAIAGPTLFAGASAAVGTAQPTPAGGAARPSQPEPAAQPEPTPEPAAPPIAPERARVGVSTSGVPIEVWMLGAPGEDAMGRARDQRPAVLVVAGLQGYHTVGPRTAEAVARQIGERHADLLASRTVYVIPSVNPDGDKWITGDGTPRMESGRIPGSGDADGDGRVDEDPAEDLNGDGMITQMRVRNPDSRWGLRANLMPDPDEPRLMREAKATEGEVGEWAVLMEGVDNDGDGRFNEDGAGGSSGGTDLGMNFPTHYPEHDDGAGRYPLSSPEALALVKWVQAHNNILAVVVYDPHDTLVNVPATGQYGPEGSVPRGIEEGDKPYHQHVADAFKEVTRMSGAPTGRTAGTFASWAYGDFGVLTFSTPVWVRPDQIKAEGADDEEAGGGDGERGRRGGEGADPRAAEREKLIAEGFPPRVADFLVASPAERQAIMQQMESMTEAERQAAMADVMSLTPAQQQRVMEAVRGGGGGGPPGAGGQRGGGGPPASGHDHEDEGSEGGGERLNLQTIAQPAGGFGGGGRRFGGQPGGGPAGGGAGGGRSTPGSSASGGEDGKWLTYSDEQREGAGFVAWKPFEHPQLGPVEIGGFVPGFRVNPPDSELERLATEQTAFLAKLLPMLPDVVLEEVQTERVADGLWRVRARLTNPGFLPTVSAIGQKARRVTPIVVQISTEPTRVLSGQRLRRVDSIDGSGGVRESEWLIQAPRGEAVTIEVRSDVFGTQSRTIRLGTTNPGANGGVGR